MFEGLFSRFASIGVLGDLCRNAERHARAEGVAEPGAEHFVLAALDLKDGSAQKVFADLGIHTEAYRQTLAENRREALARVGLPQHALEAGPSDLPPITPLYEAAESGKALVQALAARRGQGRLNGAQVLAAVAAMPHGAAPRAFRTLGISSEALARAAQRVAA